jgi:hypothetical protein
VDNLASTPPNNNAVQNRAKTLNGLVNILRGERQHPRKTAHFLVVLLQPVL